MPVHTLMMCAEVVVCVCTPAHIPMCVQQRVMPLHPPLLCHVQQYNRALHVCCHTLCVQQQGTMPLHTLMLCA
jgi:hypothetical protein